MGERGGRKTNEFRSMYLYYLSRCNVLCPDEKAII